MSRPINYRLRRTIEGSTKFVIQQKFNLFWIIPIWFNTNISGNNASRLNKIVTKMNRGS